MHDVLNALIMAHGPGFNCRKLKSKPASKSTGDVRESEVTGMGKSVVQQFRSTAIQSDAVQIRSSLRQYTSKKHHDVRRIRR